MALQQGRTSRCRTAAPALGRGHALTPVEELVPLGALREEQLAELREHLEALDLGLAARYEKELRHDVMAHVHAWGDSCPKARPILHLGATSCFVGDNTDLILLREALQLVRAQLVGVVANLKAFAAEHRALPTLGFTHFQPAQATTVGKRACLWLQDLLQDLEDLDHAEEAIRFRGVKGTTGTQASFLELFEGDHAKVRELDRLVTERMGFARTFGVTGQTYPRKLDFRVTQVLSSIAQSTHKFATDLRLLANRREVEEPFRAGQKGSSAMPHKRNPITGERLTGLARVLRGNALAALENVALWHERDISHSSVERVIFPDSCTLLDYMLNKLSDLTDGLIVYPANMERNMQLSLGMWHSQTVLLALIQKGLTREASYALVQRNAMETWKSKHAGDTGADFKKQLLKDREVAKHFKKGELEKLCSTDFHYRQIKSRFKKLGIV